MLFLYVCVLSGVTYPKQLFLLEYHYSRKFARFGAMSTKQFDLAETLGCDTEAEHYYSLTRLPNWNDLLCTYRSLLLFRVIVLFYCSL